MSDEAIPSDDATPPVVEPYKPFHPGRQLIAFIAILIPFAIIGVTVYFSWGWIKTMVERFYQ